MLMWMIVAVTVHTVRGSNLMALHESSSENRASSAAKFCTDLNPQTGLDIEQIMGLWYGSEVITHLGHEDGESIYDTCVVIHLADITNSTNTSEYPSRDQGPDVRFGTSYGYPGDRTYHSTEEYGNRRYQNRQQHQQQHQQHQQQQHNYRQPFSNTQYLRLIWDEKDHTLEYTLRYNNTRPGFWIASTPQTGTMVQLSYNQFSGTVQVLKAINNQLVLTFCQSLPGGQLFSVVLSRHPMGLSPEENQSIRNLLKKRNLSTTSVRKVCYSGASTQSSLGILSALFIALLLHCITK
ncbi:uncharacterized protein LOC131430330 [Malaya genurostris]|uniref:uncharacterized protein LOC131430330 n=1 Tax=Malaya genurostris TaxID=325434 RepID=UPI0026F3AF9D|nr:uncharacterized protein LOC131430330 [Malaya genurostris]